MSETKYKEILKLRDMLIRAGIPFEFRELNGGYQIMYPNNENRVCSVVEHTFSYGNTYDLLEIMGLLTKAEAKQDEVVGFLGAEKVFKRIHKHYSNNK
jgi:hypothetical protein